MYQKINKMTDLIMALGPEGRPYSDQRVRPFVRCSVRSSQIICLTGSTLCSLLLQVKVTKYFDFVNLDV